MKRLRGQKAIVLFCANSSKRSYVCDKHHKKYLSKNDTLVWIDLRDLVNKLRFMVNITFDTRLIDFLIQHFGSVQIFIYFLA